MSRALMFHVLVLLQKYETLLARKNEEHTKEEPKQNNNKKGSVIKNTQDISVRKKNKKEQLALLRKQ